MHESLPFELILEIDHLSPDVENDILDDHDSVFAYQNGIYTITITSPGIDARAALVAAVGDLHAYGVGVRRLVPDLVGRSEIAARADLTRQAVSNWSRGERHDGFPSVYLPTGGGLWLWGEVNSWLAEHDHQHDDLRFPSRREQTILDADLQTNRLGGGAAQVHIDFGFLPHAHFVTSARVDDPLFGELTIEDSEEHEVASA